MVSTIDFFAKLPFTRCAEILQFAKFRHYEAQEVVVQEGTIGLMGKVMRRKERRPGNNGRKPLLCSPAFPLASVAFSSFSRSLSTALGRTNVFLCSSLRQSFLSVLLSFLFFPLISFFFYTIVLFLLHRVFVNNQLFVFLSLHFPFLSDLLLSSPSSHLGTETYIMAMGVVGCT